jgi:hypothetical protein
MRIGSTSILKQAHHTECTKFALPSCFEITLCVTRVQAAIKRISEVLEAPARCGTLKEFKMRKAIPVFAVMAIATALTACDTRDNRTSNQTGSTVPPTQTAPPATPAAPADTAPATAVAPMPAPTATEGAPTAQDKASPDPLKEMTKAEESRSMPMAGQGDSHSSPSRDAKK